MQGTGCVALQPFSFPCVPCLVWTLHVVGGEGQSLEDGDGDMHYRYQTSGRSMVLVNVSRNPSARIGSPPQKPSLALLPYIHIWPSLDLFLAKARRGGGGIRA